MSTFSAPSVVYSTDPYIAQYDNWLSDTDIDLILSKDFEFVTGRIRHKDGVLRINPIRHCQTYRVEYGKDAYFDSLTQRVADFFDVHNLMCVEPFPIIKYEKNCYFHWHTDLSNGFGTQRIATMIMYLNDDFEGGVTCFQHNNIKVQPRRGSALVFYYNPLVPLPHCGEPVTSGTKFILTAFLRDGEFTLEDRKSVTY